MKSILIFLMLAGLALGANAQLQLPADFETLEADTLWMSFGNGDNNPPENFGLAENPDKAGINTSDNCILYRVLEQAVTWVGAYSEAYGPIEITAENYLMEMMVYKDVVSDVFLKLEKGTGNNFEIKASNTVIGEWELLTFNMSGAIGFSFEGIAFFPDFPSMRETGSTCYIDNIRFYNCGTTNIQLENNMTSPVCYGGSDGEISLTVNGTNPPFTYLWSNGATTKDINGLIQGRYKVIVTDSEECANSTVIKVTDPPQMIISESIYEPLCKGDSNGSIKIDLSGGTGPFNTRWSNNESSDSISNLPEGYYSVQVTDYLDCMASKDLYMSDPNPISINLMSQENLCHADNSGSITIEVDGGKPPYMKFLNDMETESIANNLPAGDYTVEVVDDNKCKETDFVTLVNPAKVSISDISGTNNVEESLIYIYSVTDQENYNFHWIVTSGNVITGQGTNIVAIQWDSEESGVIMAIAESDHGCYSDTVEMNVSISSTTGSSEYGKKGFDIYPNPVNKLLTIETEQSDHILINLTSLNGQLIFKTEIEGTSHQIDLDSFQKGIYFLTIRSKNFVITRKIIKL